MKAITALALVGSFALAACGSSGDSSSPAAASASASAGGSSASTTEVEMYDNYFKPKTITGKPGATVEVELKNEGKSEHNFKIDGQKADADLEPGKDGKVSVVIPKSGSVQFYCEYHKGLGMVGTVKAT